MAAFKVFVACERRECFFGEGKNFIAIDVADNHEHSVFGLVVGAVKIFKIALLRAVYDLFKADWHSVAENRALKIMCDFLDGLAVFVCVARFHLRDNDASFLVYCGGLE